MAKKHKTTSKSKPMSPKAGFTKKKRRYEDGGNLKK